VLYPIICCTLSLPLWFCHPASHSNLSSQQAEKIPQEQNYSLLLVVSNSCWFLLGFSTWTDLQFSVSYQKTVLAKETHHLHLGLSLEEIQKLSLGNWPVAASRTQVQVQGQLPEVTSAQPLQLAERFLLKPKPSDFC